MKKMRSFISCLAALSLVAISSFSTTAETRSPDQPVEQVDKCLALVENYGCFPIL